LKTKNSSDEIKVTIITVTYNAERFIERTIQSIIGQDYPNIEYIVIDGGSDDDTINIIKKHEEYIAYWISEPDGGIYDAMNKGIEVATGEWINFMNAGDSFARYFTLTQVVSDLEEDVEVVCGGINVMQDNKSLLYLPPVELDNICNKFPCNHQAMFVRSVLLQKYKFNLNYKIASDADMMMKLYSKGHKFTLLDYPIANYLKDGFWEENFIKAHIELLYIASQYCANQKELIRHTSLLELQNKSNYYALVSMQRFLEQLDKIKLRYSKIALYGDGVIGRLFRAYMADQQPVVFDTFKYDHNNIYSPSEIQKIEFDVIIITAIGREDEIKHLLFSLGVTNEKIICLS